MMPGTAGGAINSRERERELLEDRPNMELERAVLDALRGPSPFIHSAEPESGENSPGSARLKNRRRTESQQCLSNSVK